MVVVLVLLPASDVLDVVAVVDDVLASVSAGEPVAGKSGDRVVDDSGGRVGLAPGAM